MPVPLAGVQEPYQGPGSGSHKLCPADTGLPSRPVPGAIVSDLALDARVALPAVLWMCLSGAQQAASGTVARKEILVMGSMACAAS